MSNERDPNSDASQPIVYQIRTRSQLVSLWTEWFEGMTIQPQDNGDTLLTGPVIDQAALHGLIRKLRDLGLPLISVMPLEPEQTGAPVVEP